MIFKDKTFCASPNCRNDCGHKMTELEESQLKQAPDYTQVSYSFLCGVPSLKKKV